MKKSLIALAALMAISASATAAPAVENFASKMATDFAAFQAKAQIFAAYEKREEPSLKTVGDALDKIATAFDEYKKTNDARLEAIKAGKGTADLDAKLAKMDEHMTSMSEAKTKIEKLEAKMARPGIIHDALKDVKSKEEIEHRNAFANWVRMPHDSEAKTALTIAQKANDERRVSDLKSQGVPERRAAQVATTTGAAGGFAGAGTRDSSRRACVDLWRGQRRQLHAVAD